MKCFYHNDADGKCAGFWVHYRARLALHTETMDFIIVLSEARLRSGRKMELSIS